MSLNLGDVLVRFLGDNEDFLKATKENIKATDKLEKETASSLKAISKQSKATGRALTAGLTVPITAGLAISGAAFLRFDDKMTESLSIMGNVNEGMRKELAQTAKQLSGESIFSAAELAESYFFLASAGKTAEQSIKLLPVVTKFATAGNFELALATDLLTDAQSALGLTSNDAAKDLINMARVSDVLVKANTLANASVQQFAESLTNRAGASLRLLNKDVEEGVAVLAVFADQGIKGARAGEGLAIVLRDLQTKAEKNAEAFKASGIAVFDQDGKMRKISAIIKDLTGRIGNMSDEQRRAELSMLGFTDRSIANLQALVGTSEQIERYEKALRSAGGITDEVANKQMASFSKQLIALKNNIANTAASFGESFIPALVDMGNSLKPTLKRLQDMDDGTKNLIITLGIIAAAVGPVLIAFGLMAGAILQITALFASAVVVMIAGSAGIIAAVGAIAISFFILGGKIHDAFSGIPQIEADTKRLTDSQERLAKAMVKVNAQAAPLLKEQRQLLADKAARNEETSLENVLKLNIRISEFNIKRIKLAREARRARQVQQSEAAGGDASGFGGIARALEFAEALKKEEMQLNKTKDALAELNEEERKAFKKEKEIKETEKAEEEATAQQQALEAVIATNQKILTDFILTEEQKTVISLIEEKKRAEIAAQFVLDEQRTRTLAETEGEEERARIRKAFREKEKQVMDVIETNFQSRLSALSNIFPELKGVVQGTSEAIRAERDDVITKEEKDIDNIEKNTKKTTKVLDDIRKNGITINNIGIAEIR